MIIVSVVGIRFLFSLHHPSHSLPFVAFNLNRVFYDDYRISFGILNIVSLFDIPPKYSAFVFGFAGSKWEIMWTLINKWYSRLTFNFDFWLNRLLANSVRKKVPFLLCIYSFIHFNIVGTISARTFDGISFRYVIYQIKRTGGVAHTTPCLCATMTILFCRCVYKQCRTMFVHSLYDFRISFNQLKLILQKHTCVWVCDTGNRVKTRGGMRERERELIMRIAWYQLI